MIINLLQTSVLLATIILYYTYCIHISRLLQGPNDSEVKGISLGSWGYRVYNMLCVKCNPFSNIDASPVCKLPFHSCPNTSRHQQHRPAAPSLRHRRLIHQRRRCELRGLLRPPLALHSNRVPLRVHLHVLRVERIVHRVAQFALPHPRTTANRETQGSLDPVFPLGRCLAPLLRGLPLVAAAVEGEAPLRLCRWG